MKNDLEAIETFWKAGDEIAAIQACLQPGDELAVVVERAQDIHRQLTQLLEEHTP